MIDIKRMKYSSPGFWKELDVLLAWEEAADMEIEDTVRTILSDVRSGGDTAVLEYTRRLDQRTVSSADDLQISVAELEAAFNELDAEQRVGMVLSADHRAPETLASVFLCGAGVRNFIYSSDPKNKAA